MTTRAQRLPVPLVRRGASVAVGMLLPLVSALAGDVGREQVDPVGVWPMQPEPAVVHPFAPPSGPFGPGHRGVDLAGRVGQTVRAALPGRVAYAAALAGRGVVVVDHGATRTTYEPVAADVHRGDVVEAGDRLGTLELSGSHCFPAACLHWGWLRDRTYLDPLDLLGRRPVRLLPLEGSLPGPP
ncbi:murein hydrolase activator EnvC family protein [Nocardioides sp.]|uniref:murein hydrolase activator EnvC family protein n=1 Tax=Nocardioides sp. TaxID=35761 RepID=UPI003D0DB352